MDDQFIVLSAVLFSAGFWFWAIRQKDHYDPEPMGFLCKIAVLGGIMSTIPSGFLNGIFTDDTDNISVTAAFFQYGFVGFNEEFWKLAATVFLIKDHRHFDEPVDGIIYAATVALGFAAIENIEYISREGLGVLVVRHFLSVPGHLAFAMLSGYGLTVAKFKYPERNWLSVLWPYYFAAATFHGLYDFSAVVLPEGINAIVISLLVVLLYRFSSKRCRQLLLHSPLRPADHCPECKTENKKNSRFCRQCGSPLLVAEEFPILKRIICQHCATLNPVNAKFCMKCGNSLTG